MASKAVAALVRSVGSRRAAPALLSTGFLSFTFRRSYSAESPIATPPLLAKLKGDLKAAMKAKDTPRLSVLRAILAAVLNASKTESPIRTDAQLVGLLRKTEATSLAAVEEFRAAKRQDLVDKEQAQVGVLQEYIKTSGLEVFGREELREAVSVVMRDLATDQVPPKSQLGEAIKRLLAPGGPLDGKDFSKSELAELVKEQVPKA